MTYCPGNWTGARGGGQAQNGGHGPLPGAAPDDDDESSTTNGAKVDVFVEQWVSVVCGMTAHGMACAADSKFSNRHVTFE